MDENQYYGLLSNYRKGTELILTTNRGQGEISNDVEIDYVPDKNGKLIPQLRFLNGGNIFDPKAIGGVEKIISLIESADGQC